MKTNKEDRKNLLEMKKNMGKRWKRTAALFVAGSLLLSGCGKNFGEREKECPYEEFLVVDVFDSLANYQGIQSGWFAELVRDKFNMELNIIAPNVAGGGDTLFEIRSAAGNLGDLIICSGDNGTLQNLVTAGLIQDMEPYIENSQIMRFETAIRGMNENFADGGIYAIPTELSENSPFTPSEVLEPTYGPYLRWDLYRQLGYPKMETLEDMLPVLKQMQELCPVTENGEKTYGISFFRDWDANLMNAAKQPCCFYGYDEYGFLLVSADGKEFQSILDSDSMYMRVLKWYFDANQMGLVDPESTTQNYEAFTEKYKNGQILYCSWPWASQTYYNTAENKEQGKGYMMADIEDMKIYSYGCSPEGNHKSVVAIGSQAKDPQRIADFIDWLYSSEGIRSIGVGTMSGTAGPEGLCWEYGKDGPYLTEFGKKALMGEEVQVPEEWGGGSWQEGISELNFLPVARCELDEKGYPYQYQVWDSVVQGNETALEKEWKAQMGADTTMEYLIENEKLAVSPGCGYSAPPETPEQSAIRRQCRSVILEYSWEMVFAESEEDFYRLRDEMQKKAVSLGYETILALDLENAKEKEALRWETAEKYREEK